jgi:formiminotetrahydrofolate cyclodeaminase
MSNFANQKIEEFLENLESSSPTPGGGTSAAIGAAISCALIAMVANLTIGKKNYEKKEKEAKEILKAVLVLKEKCMKLADDDSNAFMEVMNAYKLSKEDKNRKEKIQRSLKKAVEIPLMVAKISKTLIAFAKVMAKIGNKNAYSDAKSAEYFAKASEKSAMENVKINMPFITDEKWKENIINGIR